ncbi:hypothetical protein [Pseudomonas fluorescens]
MGWFNTILNIGSTIGKVCGALQGGSNSNLAAHFGSFGSVNPAIGGLVFYYDTTVAGGPLTAANQNVNQPPITLTFLNNPLVGNLAQTITLPSMSKIPIGPAFATASRGGDESFTATFNNSAQSSGKQDDSASINVMVQGACNTLLISGSSIQVGSYFTATLNGTQITISVLGMFTLNNVLQVNIQSSGGVRAQLIQGPSNSTSGTLASTGPVVVNVPLGIDISQGIPHIEILGLIATSSNLADINFEYVTRHKPLSAADKATIKQLEAAW